MDKTTYLNHYYLISCISFLMIFLPASSYFSIDSGRNKFHIPKWSVDSIKILLIIVYLYAGLAKINSDWICLYKSSSGKMIAVEKTIKVILVIAFDNLFNKIVIL